MYKTFSMERIQYFLRSFRTTGIWKKCWYRNKTATGCQSSYRPNKVIKSLLSRYWISWFAVLALVRYFVRVSVLRKDRKKYCMISNPLYYASITNNQLRIMHNSKDLNFFSENDHKNSKINSFLKKKEMFLKNKYVQMCHVN
jgi:hypothetical protein